MASAPPKVGDTVFVPGGMHGTLKFVGVVNGKRGTFAGVQLAPEYASRGKNSGDVEGKHYFRTTVLGSGIFLPLEKAVKMDRQAPATPKTPGGGLSNFNQGGRAITPAGLATLPKSNFSQTVGPGMRPTSPLVRGAGPGGRRESLPRPTSPLRKVQPATTPTAVGKLTTPKTRPSLGFARSVVGHPNGTQYRPSPAGRNTNSKFSQSLRQSMVTPSKGLKLSPLGPEASFDEEEPGAEATPTPTVMVAAGGRNEQSRLQHDAETNRLKESLEERDRQLKDQAGSIAEMEKTLAELQSMLPSLEGGIDGPEKQRNVNEERLSVDVVTLRATLREKNDKIKLLTAEFDANRADFRSTIDTLEMASSETERVYEKRVDELLEEVRQLQDRSEDVSGLAEQMRQLEELVQELEEGLEDARRGEAEARGEVEFLRGEVERGRAEVRRLKEERFNGDSSGGGDIALEELEEMRMVLEQKEDEVRGLKAIIHEMNRKSVDYPVSKTNGNGPSRKFSESTPVDYRVSRELERQISELKTLLSQKVDREEQLENEVSRLRSDSISRFPGPPSMNRKSGGVNVVEKHRSAGTNGSHRLSDRTVVPISAAGRDAWHDAGSTPGSPAKYNHSRSQSQRTLEVVDEGNVHHSQSYNHDEPEDSAKSTSGVTDASSTALWCEICEEGGHDILTCRNMFGTNGSHKKSNVEEPERTSSESQRKARDVVREGLRRSQGHADMDRPAPLSMGSRKAALSDDVNSTPKALAAAASTLPPPPVAALPRPEENQAGMVAGKSNGTIDVNKWCALCERDGHESVDCPFEDAF